MNRKALVGLIVGAVVLLSAGLYWWLRPHPAATPPAVTTSAPATSAGAFTKGAHDNGFGEQVPVLLTEDKQELARRYQLPYIKEYYETDPEHLEYPDETGEGENRAPLPPFDYNQSLAGKSYLDLLLLRNEQYARNGYCFMNATVRHYFGRKKWYRPLWAEAEYDKEGNQTQPADSIIPVPLNQQEMAFIQRVRAAETTLLQHRIQRQGAYDMLGLDYVTNLREEHVDPAMRPVLARNNFVLVPTREEQLFYLYDQNEYSYTPSFITTDLVLQLLHKYLNGILSDVEETRLVPVVATMLREGSAQALVLARRSQNLPARDAAEWAAAYYAVGHGLLLGVPISIEGAYGNQVAPEIARATAATAKASWLLQDSLYDYTALKPRGLYTRTDTTRRYFRAVRWLNTAPVFLDSDAGLLRAVALAQALEASPAGTSSFKQFTQVLNVLVGEEDNRSVTHLLSILKSQYAGQTLDQLSAPATLARLRRQLVAAGTNRIRARGATDKAVVALARPTLLFTAGRYTFDAEILGRLVNLKRPMPDQAPPRPFPKGLDVFAVFGNRTAQQVLLQDYREATRWPAYPDTLGALQRQFAGFSGWDQNVYTKTMQLLLALQAPASDKAPPLFARTPAWQKRNLSTALGGWTELKHDLLLYTEQPSGAEAGGPGGGPPAPHHLAYVEPNLPFWEAALALLAHQDRSLSRLNANTEHLAGLNQEIRELVTLLRDATRKEISHQPLTQGEMNSLMFMGGKIEQLTIKILKTDVLPDREKHIGLVADVYAFNQDVLEEAVGAADALYVVVEINGVPVLARGAAFSYYEFTSPRRLTDEEWRAMLARQEPARPTWLQELIVPVKALATKSGDPDPLY